VCNSVCVRVCVCVQWCMCAVVELYKTACNLLKSLTVSHLSTLMNYIAGSSKGIDRVGQNRVYTLYLIIYSVISCRKYRIHTV
jgi:hypothetical protein